METNFEDLQQQVASLKEKLSQRESELKKAEENKDYYRDLWYKYQIANKKLKEIISLLSEVLSNQ